MDKNVPKKVIDITGIELTPGEPTVCLGNGMQGFECCCDECDYFLLCFPEFDSDSLEDIARDKDNSTKEVEKGLLYVNVKSAFALLWALLSLIKSVVAGEKMFYREVHFKFKVFFKVA